MPRKNANLQVRIQFRKSLSIGAFLQQLRRYMEAQSRILDRRVKHEKLVFVLGPFGYLMMKTVRYLIPDHLKGDLMGWELMNHLSWQAERWEPAVIAQIHVVCSRLHRKFEVAVSRELDLQDGHGCRFQLRASF